MKKTKKIFTKGVKFVIIINAAVVAEWQTRYLEGVVP